MCAHIPSIGPRKEKNYHVWPRRFTRKLRGWIWYMGSTPVTSEPPKLRKQIISQNVCLWTPYRYLKAQKIFAGKNWKKPQGGWMPPPPLVRRGLTQFAQYVLCLIISLQTLTSSSETETTANYQ